ncbi:PQQ-dependent sugar dehydrogenase [Flavobacteriales bacterium]|nr:PQQ-dependent sugar dehydrogenase [Flavobacteriales bacterium]
MSKYIFTILLLFFFTQSISQTHELDNGTVLSEREVTGGLDVPWEIKWGPDNHIWVTERSGQISRVNVETGEKFPILNLIAQLYDAGESGLLGMEIHPDFNNGAPYVFLAYTYGFNGNASEKIVYYEYDAEQDALINETVIIDGIDGNSTHIGCRLLAVDNTTLLITTGDAQNWNASQDVDALTGKTLRVDIDKDSNNFGGPKSDNPNPNSFVYTIGHRNAQGLAVSPEGIIYSSEHGPNNDDELNVIQANLNYGWPNAQGFCDDFADMYYANALNNSYSENEYCEDNDIVEPLWSSGTSSTIAPSDIIWYNHPSIPEFQNSLLMTVLKGKKLVRFTFNETGDVIETETDFFQYEWGRLRDICIAPNGKIYLATNGNSWPSQGPNEIIELSNNDYVYPSTFNCTVDGCVEVNDGLGEYSNIDDCNVVCSTSPTSIDKYNNNFFSFYPNPNSSDGQLIFNSDEDLFQIEILNIQGQLIHSQTVENNRMNLEGMLENGVYFIKAQNQLSKLIIK